MQARPMTGGGANRLTRVAIMPAAPIAEKTEYIKAGPVTIGIEFRHVHAALVKEEFRKQGFRPEDTPKDVADERGVSLHVFGEKQGKLQEFIRFDCLEAAPHYHYICYAEYLKDDVSHTVIGPIDADAVGDPIEWALGRIKTRLPAMLARVGATALGSQVQGNKDFEAALPKVAAAAERCRATAAAAAR